MKTFISILLLIVISPVFAQSAPTPCASDDHGAFDFWLGEWKVTLPDGSHAGDNTLTKIQGGCIIQENWRSATSPFTGTSFNFYNGSTNQWEQIWLDNQGGNLHMKGNREGNQMIMRTATTKNEAGQDTYNQIAWTSNKDGSVRQLWTLVIDGADDQIVFDGLYKRPE